VLTAVVSREHVPGRNSPISLAEMRCEKFILVTASGENYLVLRDRWRLLQLRCLGDSIAFDSGAMALLVDELPNVEPEIRLLRRFSAIYRARESNESTTAWSPQSMRLRNALVALDGSLNGATYREIAEHIHGPEMVADAWRGSRRDLKDRMVRLVRRGHHLSAGGYRDLLQ